MSATPLDYLFSSAGRRADVTLPLTWFMLIVSVVVCLVVAGLLLGSLRGAKGGGAAETAAEPVRRDHAGGLRWITIGLAISSVPLLISLIWTMAALAQVAGPPRRPEMTIDVTAHQWWWEADYHGTEPADSFVTANEIHIPVGVPVEIRLRGGDVIHSFWVPQLAGKTDTIPGQQNIAWLEARRPGIFRGQCAEYCGAEHAKMGFEVVAQPMAEFQRWRQDQLQPAPPPATQAQRQGYALTMARCGLCHAIRGTSATARGGPDLTHLMSRRLIAAAMLPNNPGALGGWIQDPQGVKPGALMPAQHLSGEQLTDVIAYLETLQ
ncbi:cytochrome c oxidase subunit II [Sphingomonas oligoaromativorans]|uniref:cytochrome c oxidase subunit II n=1 Tax=Sphingomonas oligoaromativorans TaxID=575322 RepID=UPI00141DE295|nr:cytochrome c oxidase subunit II [Sphingomonas oligoaromativorans]NIJ33384.1 cytochrome c oxidase subunit 2 [Sphingomonas oligoaromativorans]